LILSKLAIAALPLAIRCLFQHFHPIFPVNPIRTIQVFSSATMSKGITSFSCIYPTGNWNKSRVSIFWFFSNYFPWIVPAQRNNRHLENVFITVKQKLW
jgi:hypothetical protein